MLIWQKYIVSLKFFNMHLSRMWLKFLMMTNVIKFDFKTGAAAKIAADIVGIVGTE